MNKRQVPKDVLNDFDAHLWCCFKYLGIGEPTKKQYAIGREYVYGPQSLMLLAGRKDGKSVVLATVDPFRKCHNPNRTALCLSATGPRARSFLEMTRRLYSMVPYLRHLSPEVIDDEKDNMSAYQVAGRTSWNQDPSFAAASLTGQITGLHADDVYIDDGEIPENSDSPQAREKLESRFTEAIEHVWNRPEDGILRVIGTYQTFDSIYLKLPLTTLKFPSEMPDKENPDDCVNVAPYILNLDLGPGESTQPERFTTESLKAAEARMGPKAYALHYKLNPSLSDLAKYPLRLKDLIVLDADTKLFPMQVVWGAQTEHKQIPCWGISGDKCFVPAYISSEYTPYLETIVAVDPAGHGEDELAIAVVSSVSGFIVYHEVLGYNGGYAEANLNKIAYWVNQFSASSVVVESNFGDGMFTQLLKPVLYKACPTVGIHEVKVTGRKERRCLDVLEPLFNSHRIVFTPRAISDKETQTQITRLRDKKNALKRDDRIDVMALAAAYFQRDMDLTPQVAITKSAKAQHKQLIQDLQTGRKALALLGDRVSGAVLINGVPFADLTRKSRNIFARK